MSYEPLPHDSKAPDPSGILPNTHPDSVAVWTIDVDAGSGQRYGDAVMQPPGPPPPPEPITVVMAAHWSSGNTYMVGEEIFAEVAAFKGGPSDTMYRYRWQQRENADAAWVSTPFTSYSNHALEVSFRPTMTGQVRLQCNAKNDSADPAETVNSFASLQDVGQYTMGVAEVWDSADPEETRLQNGGTVFLPGGSNVTYIGDVTGTVPKNLLRYEWKVRNGEATIRGDDKQPFVTVQHGQTVNATSSISCSIYAVSGYVTDNLGFQWSTRYT